MSEEMLLATYHRGVAQTKGLIDLGFTIFQTDDDHIDTNEVAPGVWDFSPYEEQMREVQALGGCWMFFPHNCFPPKWYRETVPYVRLRCLEHDRTIEAFSIWEPKAYEYLDRAYEALAEHFGTDPDNIYAFYIGVYGDYGECQFPAACRIMYNQDWENYFGNLHNHYGWWCGDELARRDFRTRMLEKYGALPALNAAWGTDWVEAEQIAYPPLDASRRRWYLDFVRWYCDSMERYGRACAELLRKHFPRQLLVYPMGAEDEDPRIGQDYSALVRMAAEVGAQVRSTHGGFYRFDANAVSQMAHLGSACKLYGVPFWTEPQSGIPPHGQVGRIFECLCEGSEAFWDWDSNVTTPEGGAVIAKYRHLLRKDRPLVEACALFPQTDHYLHPGQDFPKRYRKLGRQARVLAHFDVADEAMIADGALDAYRFLIHFEGRVFEERTLRRILAWVREGGVFCLLTDAPLETVEGDTGLYTWELDPGADPRGAVRRIGKGAVCALRGGEADGAAYLAFLRRCLYREPPNGVPLRSIDTGAEQVYGLLYPDGRALVYNMHRTQTRRIELGGRAYELPPASITECGRLPL